MVNGPDLRQVSPRFRPGYLAEWLAQPAPADPVHGHAAEHPPARAAAAGRPQDVRGPAAGDGQGDARHAAELRERRRGATGQRPARRLEAAADPRSRRPRRPTPPRPREVPSNAPGDEVRLRRSDRVAEPDVRDRATTMTWRAGPAPAGPVPTVPARDCTTESHDDLEFDSKTDRGGPRPGHHAPPLRRRLRRRCDRDGRRGGRDRPERDGHHAGRGAGEPGGRSPRRRRARPAAARRAARPRRSRPKDGGRSRGRSSSAGNPPAAERPRRPGEGRQGPRGLRQGRADPERAPGRRRRDQGGQECARLHPQADGDQRRGQVGRLTGRGRLRPEELHLRAARPGRHERREGPGQEQRPGQPQRQLEAQEQRVQHAARRAGRRSPAPSRRPSGSRAR